MKSGNFYSDNDDLVFHVTKRFPYEEIYSLLSDDQKEVVGAESTEEYAASWLEVLEAFGTVAADAIAPNASVVERKGLSLKDGEVVLSDELAANIAAMKDFGVASFSTAPKYGGMGAVPLFEMVGCEVLNRACPSTLLNTSWYGSISKVFEAFASEEMRQEWVPKIAAGEVSGNMALTEPDAGSDLSALRSYAEKDEEAGDDSYRIYGTKRFITNGNSEISLVLAKNEKGAVGLDHLSLYVVPRKLEDGTTNITITKLEEKVALHGSATCELAFDGAKGWLLGEDGKGYRYMLMLMNDSRLGVGFQGIGLMEASYRIASDYAQERRTWGKAIAQHELIAEKLLDLEVELKATRSLGYQSALASTLATLGEEYIRSNDLSAEERKRVEKLVAENKAKLRAYTPLLKYWVGEKSVEHARSALQVLGGYGFTTEYGAERWVRESLIYAVYEGTSQMQALMCVKDLMKNVLQRPKAFVEDFFQASYKRYLERDTLERRMLQISHTVQQTIVAVLIKLVKLNFKTSFSETSKSDLRKLMGLLRRDLVKIEDYQPALLHAERLCQMRCYEEMTRVLIADVAYDPSRRRLAERFSHMALAKVRYLNSMIVDEDDVILDQLAGLSSATSEIHADA